jgi:LysR family transcriptional regulator for metE and metH
VSRALLAAEDKLGVALFERRARGVVPTAAGERLVAGAGSVLAQLALLEQRVRDEVPSAPVRVVCECYTAYRWLPSTLATLERSGAKLDVSLAFDQAISPVAGLESGDVDIALLTTSRVPKSLVEQPLFSDEIIFLVSALHPLASRPTIERQDLARYPLITSTQTPAPESRWFFDRVFGKRGPKGIERLALPLTEAIVDAARAGMGIAVMSEWIALPYLATGDLLVKRLRTGPLDRPWRIAFTPAMRARAERLAAAIGAAAPKLPPRA